MVKYSSLIYGYGKIFPFGYQDANQFHLGVLLIIDLSITIGPLLSVLYHVFPFIWV